MTFSQRLKIKRKECGFTQEQLAALTGLNINSIKKLETTRMMPSIESLEKFCIAFKCTADYLLGWDVQLQQNAIVDNRLEKLESIYSELLEISDFIPKFAKTVNKLNKILKGG